MTIGRAISALAFAAAMAAVGVSYAAPPSSAGASQPSLADRGRQTMAMIERTFAAKGRDAGYYMEEAKPNDPKFRSHVCYAWGVGLQLSALNAAAQVDPATFKPRLLQYAHLVQTYWYVDKNGLGGFCAAPHPTSGDRYYDDNAWICLDFCETYELTHDKAWLEAAKKTWAFMLSGRDDKLGGGIYWYENKKTSKNTCINAPAAVCGVRLYALTGDKACLDTARQLYDWTKKNLQDPADGLYFDSINLDGKLSKPKYSYNTALMLRASCLLYEQTHDGAYLDEAGRLARAAEAKWLRPDGSADDVAYFGNLLIDAMLEYGRVAKDPHWTDVAVRTCDFLWQHNRAPDGHFPEHWDQRPDKPLEKYKVMFEASDARVFFRTAEAVGKS